MGALVGLGLGLGLLLIWAAFCRPQVVAAEPRARSSRRRIAALASAALAAVGAVAVTGLVVLGPVVAVLAMSVPRAVVRTRARRRRRELAEVWPDAVDDLASAVRAGMSLPDAVAALAVRGPEPLRPAFEAFALDYQASGRFGDCLDRL
ncbi:type II secretion system F family protein, partial [Nocardioides ginsengisoli]